MRKVLDVLEHVISSWVLVILLVLAFVNVVCRYFIHSSIAFTDEICTNLFVALSVLGAAIAAKREAHLGLSIITDRLPERIRRRVIGVNYLLCAFFSAFLCYCGIGMVRNQIMTGSMTQTLQWPKWMFGLALPIGAAFMTIEFVLLAGRKLKSGEKEA